MPLTLRHEGLLIRAEMPLKMNNFELTMKIT